MPAFLKAVKHDFLIKIFAIQQSFISKMVLTKDKGCGFCRHALPFSPVHLPVSKGVAGLKRLADVYSVLNMQCNVINHYYFNTLCFFSSTCSVSVSPSTLGRLVSRLEMPAGSCTALSTVFSLMGRCLVTRPSVEVMIPSTPFSVRRELASMSPGQCLWIWSPLWLVSKGLWLHFILVLQLLITVGSCWFIIIFILFLRWGSHWNLPPALPPWAVDHWKGGCSQQLRSWTLHHRQGNHRPGAWQNPQTGEKLQRLQTCL